MPTNLTRWTCNTTFSSFNSQIWQRGRSSQHKESDEEAWLLCRKTSWNASPRTADLSTAETSSEAKWWKYQQCGLSTVFRLALKRKRLTSSSLTNASLLREFYPLLAYSSLLYIIKWPTACSVFSVTDHSACFGFFPAVFYWFMLYHPQAAWPCAPVLTSVKLTKPVWQWCWLCSPHYLCSKQDQARQSSKWHQM